MYKRLCALVLAIAMVFAAVCSAAAQADVGGRIEQFVAQHGDTTAGLATAVFTQNDVLYSSCFGHADVENGIPVDDATVMEWGSVTKLLVWVSVMQQVELGHIDLNADVRTYLPQGFLRELRDDVAPVTMLHLMNHNAGFEESVIGMATHDETQILELEEYLQRVQPKQVYAPGTVTAYSNWGVTLAAYIVQQVSGERFDDYAHTHIFAPLNMRHTAIRPDLSDNAYVRQARTQLRCYTADRMLIPDAFAHIVMYPAGMCTSTLGDFTAFAQAVLRRDERLMNDSSWAHLFTPSDYLGDTAIAKNHHGFWGLEYGVHVLGHHGNTAGCSSTLLLDTANGLGMVLMTNQSGESIHTQGIAQIVFGPNEHQNDHPCGLVRSARTIWHGPLKLGKMLMLSNSTLEEPNGQCVIYDEADGLPKLEAPYGDQLFADSAELLPEVLLIALWAAAMLYGIVMALAGVVRVLVRRPRSKCMRSCVWACVLMLVPIALLLIMVPTLFNMDQWSIAAYRIGFGVVLGITAAMVAAVIWLGHAARRAPLRRQRALYITTIIALLFAVVNMVYWQLGAFWMI